MMNKAQLKMIEKKVEETLTIENLNQMTKAQMIAFIQHKNLSINPEGHNLDHLRDLIIDEYEG